MTKQTPFSSHLPAPKSFSASAPPRSGEGAAAEPELSTESMPDLMPPPVMELSAGQLPTEPAERDVHSPAMQTMDFIPKELEDPSLAGRVLAQKVRLDARIGRGGMGDVYRGTHLTLGREVAVKIIRDDLILHTGVRERFQREAQLVGKLSSERIVQVFDFGTDEPGDQPPVTYLVMEFVDGENLQLVTEQLGALPWRATLPVVKDVAEALRVAHGAGVMHRDLKPENLMLLPVDERGQRRVKVLDFGIARVFDGSENEARFTSPGVVLGTPGYLAPEVLRSEPSDGRADLFALGAIWFRMLTGRDLFEGPSPRAILLEQAHKGDTGAQPAMAHLGVPPDVVAEVMRLLASDPNGRPASAAVLEARLEELIEEARRTGGAPTPLVPTANPTSLPSTSPTETDLVSLPKDPSETADGDAPWVTATLPNGQVVTGQLVGTSPGTPGTGALMVPPPSSTNKWAIAFGLLLLLVVGAGAFVLGQRQAPSTPTTVATTSTTTTTPSAPATPASTTPPPAPAAPVVAVATDDKAEPAPASDVKATRKKAPKKTATKSKRRRRSKAKTKTKKSGKKVAKAAPTKPSDVDTGMSKAAPPPKLTSKMVKRALRRQLGKASQCSNTNIKFSQTGPGLLVDHCPSYKSHGKPQMLTLTLDPSGKVTAATFRNAAVQNSKIGKCVAASLKEWTFPPFDGAPVDIKQRVEFEACVPINNVCVF